MNAQENNRLDEIFVRLGALETKLNAVIVEQANAANKRGDIYSEQHSLNNNIAGLKSDIAEMKPAVARGKTVFWIFTGLMLGIGFSVSEIKTWILKLIMIVP